VLENDLLEAIIGLPTDMFYNTGISTYVWIVSNRKPEHRRGKVQLIDASAMWEKMRRSLGSKRKQLSDEHITEITRLFGEAQEVYINEAGKHVSGKALSTGSSTSEKDLSSGPSRNGNATKPAASAVPLTPISRIFDNEDFGYRTITVERPERDAQGEIVRETRGKHKGQPKPDSSLRDTEEEPLGEDVQAYFRREVLPHVPDTWIDHDKTKIGYEIPFNRHFYVFKPPRELAEIDAELKGVTDRIVKMIGELSQ
jgi:type I restriction enzyme M protein